MKKRNQSGTDILHKKAEDSLKENTVNDDSQLPNAETLLLLHEFEVQKSERELQFQDMKRQIEELKSMNNELKLLNDQMEVQSEKYFELFDFAPSGNYTLSREGKIIMINLNGARLIGLERSLVIDKLFETYVSGDTRLSFKQFFERIFNSRSIQTCEVSLTSNGNTATIVLLTARMAETDQCIITAVDITSRKQMEMELRLKEERYYAIAQSANDAIISINDKGIIVEWNFGAEKIFGYSESEITGKPLEMIIPPQYTEQHSHNVDRVIKGGEHHVIGKTVELTGLHKNGLEFPMELSLSAWETSTGKYFTGIIRDITSRKLAEDTLKSSEERSRNIISGTNAGTWEWNVQTGETIFNERWAEIIGYSLTEISPVSFDTWIKFTHPDDLKTSGELLRKHYSGALNYYECEARMKHKNGKWIWVLTRGKVVSWTEDGKPLLMTGIHLDITLRKTAETELRENEVQYRALASSGSALIWRSGTDKLCNYFNEIWLRFTGRSLEQEMGNGWAEGVHPDDLNRCIETYISAFEKRETFEMEYRLRHASGEYRWLLDMGTPNFNSSGEFIGYIGHCFDISERKKAEELLHTTNAYLENLINYANAPIIAWDPHFRITRFNHAFEFLTGYKEVEVLGKSLNILFPPSSAKESMALIHNTSTGERWETEEIEILHRDNSIKTVLWNSATLFAPDGETPVATIAQGHDITVRKQVEKELLYTKQHLENFFNIIPDLFAIASPDGYLKSLNPEWEKTLGYTLEELQSKPFESFIHPDDIASTRQEVENQQQGHSTVQFINRYRHKDGSYRWLEWNATPSDTNSLYAAARDITNRKHADELLKNSQERLMIAQRIAHLGSWEWNMITNSLNCSDEMFRIFGINPSKFGNTIDALLDYIHPDDKESFITNLANSSLNGDSEPFEYRIIREDGEIRYMAASGNIIFDGNQDPIKGTGTIQDITERKIAEATLLLSNEKIKQSEADLSKAQSIALLGNWKWDLKTGEVIWSDGMYQIFGINKETYKGSLGEVISKIVHPDDLQKVLESNGPGIVSEKAIEYRIIMPDKAIRYIWAEAGETLVDESGKPIFLVGIAQDITDRKLIEKQLVRAKEKAEESDRLKTAFLANMSHEIRTPMNGILGFTGLLKEHGLTSKNKELYIGIIEKSGTRMLNIINDIISISKVESGQMEICISKTNVNEQIEFIFSFFKPEIENKGIKFLFKKLKDPKEAIINTDREKIYAILTNLVKNAIKFTTEGTIDLGFDKKDNHLEFYVKDSGAGILDEQKGIIFERFRQGSDSLIRNYEGAGLGLSISKAYVELLGGKIWVESEIGVGSTFRFTIPCNTEIETETEFDRIVLNKEITKPIRDLKVVIAEDDDASEKLISMIFDKYSREIIKVNSGAEVVSVCRSHQDIDLVMMDIKMPGMDGYDATRQIRQFNKDIIIIAQTAFSLSGDREKALDAGCNDYLSKPIMKDDVISLLETYFS